MNNQMSGEGPVKTPEEIIYKELCYPKKDGEGYYLKGSLRTADVVKCFKQALSSESADIDKLRVEVAELHHLLLVSTPVSEETATKHYVACIDKLKARILVLEDALVLIANDLEFSHDVNTKFIREPWYKKIAKEALAKSALEGEGLAV